MDKAGVDSMASVEISVLVNGVGMIGVDVTKSLLIRSGFVFSAPISGEPLVVGGTTEFVLPGPTVRIGTPVVLVNVAGNGLLMIGVDVVVVVVVVNVNVSSAGSSTVLLGVNGLKTAGVPKEIVSVHGHGLL